MTTTLPMDRDHIYVSLETLRGMVGTETGVSDWTPIRQDRIDAFADLTGDHQFIHVDPKAAEATPMGTTIAHGFHTLALMSYLGMGTRPRLEGVKHSVNYGIDRLRFVAPLPSGAQVRARFTLAELEERTPGEITMHYDVTVKLQGQERPALVCRLLSRSYLD
ncbi:MAG: MaoC family dehydratase, partial [Pseudomonadota bacterium]